MKKILTLILLFTVVGIALVFSADWSQYESGRDNVRLDGYQTQPGYIAFTNGNGTVRGYLWADSDGDLRWTDQVNSDSTTSGAKDLTTTKLDVPVSSARKISLGNN